MPDSPCSLTPRTTAGRGGAESSPTAASSAGMATGLVSVWRNYVSPRCTVLLRMSSCPTECVSLSRYACFVTHGLSRMVCPIQCGCVLSRMFCTIVSFFDKHVCISLRMSCRRVCLVTHALSYTVSLLLRMSVSRYACLVLKYDLLRMS